MNTNARTLACLLTVLALCVLAPLAAAGSATSPEMPDNVDDVVVSGDVGDACSAVPVGCPFKQDIWWPKADINNAWVTDNATSLLFVVEMKGGITGAFSSDPQDTGFQSAPVDCDYTFTYKVTGSTANHTAAAKLLDDGTLTAGGDAKSAATDGANLLTLVVAGSKLNLTTGAKLTSLFMTAHCESMTGEYQLDDRAPDANAGRNFTATNVTVGAAPPSPTPTTSGPAPTTGPAATTPAGTTPAGTTAGATTSAPPASSAPASTSAAAPSSSKKGTPALPVVAVLGGLAVALLARRRFD